jgi:hypothetical protein
MAGLHGLPSEILEQICDLVAGAQPRNLIPLSEVSKKCLAASSQSLWHTIPLRITSRGQITGGVDKLKHILQHRLSHDARVRCISIRGRKPLDGRKDKETKISRLERAYLDNIACNHWQMYWLECHLYRLWSGRKTSFHLASSTL